VIYHDLLLLCFSFFSLGSHSRIQGGFSPSANKNSTTAHCSKYTSSAMLEWEHCHHPLVKHLQLLKNDWQFSST
jgi:hypothetical protein